MSVRIWHRRIPESGTAPGRSLSNTLGFSHGNRLAGLIFGIGVAPHVDPVRRSAIRAAGSPRQPGLHGSGRAHSRARHRREHHRLQLGQLRLAQSAARRQQRQARLVAFESTAPNIEYQSTSFRDFQDFRDNLKQIAGLTATFLTPLRVGEGERAQRVWGELVSGNFFDVLGVKPQLGRFFAPEDQGDRSGSAPVVVLSHRLWLSQFQSDLGLGKQLLVNGRSLTVIGVARPEFNGSMACLAYELWVPVTMAPQLNVHTEKMLTDRPVRTMKIGRLKHPAFPWIAPSAEAAAFAQAPGARQSDDQRGDRRPHRAGSPSKGGAERMMLAPLQILMAMCVVVLLIVCANVANLLLARSMARRKEFSVRLALGRAGRRLARQMLTESLLLAGLGALVGIPLAMWMGRSSGHVCCRRPALPVRIDDVQLSGNVLVFTILICAAAAVVSAWRRRLHAMRPDVNRR